MKKFISISLAIMLVNCAMAQNSTLNTGKAFLGFLFAKNFSNAIDLFDASVLNQINEKTLSDVETGVTASLGNFVQPVSYREDSAGSYKTIFYYCKFEKSNIDLKVVFSDPWKIVGFYLSEHVKKNDSSYIPMNN